MAWPWLDKACALIASPFKKTGGRVWSDSGLWLLFNLVGGLLPLWGGALILTIWSQPYTHRDFMRHGEFVLYAASFLSPALGLILRDLKSTNFAFRPLFGLAVGACLLAAALTFAAVQAVAAVQPGQQAPFKLNEDFMIKVSLWLFVLSTFLAFFVTLLDGHRTQVDFKAQLTQGQKQLEKDFDGIKE